MKTDKFPLSHVVLYAKGWYKQTDNTWEDLKQILVLDDYQPFTDIDVYSILLSKFDNFNLHQASLREVLTSIHPNQCWKVGYYTKTNAEWIKDQDKFPDYDMPTAFVYYVLSTLRFLDAEQWNVTVPNYKKYPKHPNITIRKLMDCFNTNPKFILNKPTIN